jgi:Predicted unusual protein kinase
MRIHIGRFHASPLNHVLQRFHKVSRIFRGNLLREKNGNLAFIDFGMMADVTEEERYGLIGLAIGLQNKDLALITENLLSVSIK